MRDTIYIRFMAIVSICLTALFMVANIQISKLNETINTMQETIEIKEENLSVLREENLVLSTKLEYSERMLKELSAKPTADYDIFAIAGVAYEIDPILLEAICRWESGHFTSKPYKTKNNAWGAYDGENWLSFNNADHSIIELARTLRRNYYDCGLDTINLIATKYCPDSPDSWANGVKSIYEEIKKSK